MISAQNYHPLPSFIPWQTLLSLPSFLSHIQAGFPKSPHSPRGDSAASGQLLMSRDIWGHHNYRGYWRHPVGRGQGCYSTSCMHRTAPPTKHHPAPMSMLPGLISSTKCLFSATPGSLLSLHSFAHTIASAWTCFSPFPSQGFLLILWKLILPSLSCAGPGHSLHSTFSHPGYITQCFINVCVCIYI